MKFQLIFCKQAILHINPMLFLYLVGVFISKLELIGLLVNALSSHYKMWSVMSVFQHNYYFSFTSIAVQVLSLPMSAFYFAANYKHDIPPVF